jgi:hypothetical protein
VQNRYHFVKSVVDMESSYSSKRKYTSLFLAILLHWLLLVLLMRFTFKFYEGGSGIPQRGTPALVSFDSRPKGLPTALADTKTVLPSVPLEPEESEPLALEPQELPLTHPQAEPSLPLSPVAVSSPFSEATIPPSLIDSVEQEQVSVTPPASSQPRKRGQRKKRQSTLPAGLTGASFVQAFQQAARAEAYETGTASTDGNALTNSRNSEVPNHVQERLDEWKEFHYRQKVSRALVRACHLSRKYIHTENDIKEEIAISLIIGKDGSFSLVAPNPLTGIAEVDEYIAHFFSNVTLPSIPKHVQRKYFNIPVCIKLTLPKGGGYCQLEPVYE